MSLAIDSRYITGVYALGQWFKVKPDTVDIDAFQFRNWEEQSPHDGKAWTVQHTDYEMSALYPSQQNRKGGGYSDHSRGSWVTPCGCDGISFIDADTGERVSFSLVEVRAFREVRP